MIDNSNCILTDKRLSPEGHYVATLTCFRCGHSTQISFGGWSAVSCMHCSMLLERGQYISKEKIEGILARLDKRLEDMKICVSNTASAGYSIAMPFSSYRTLAKKRGIIARIINNQKRR